MTQKLYRDDLDLEPQDPKPSHGVPGKVPVTARLAGRAHHTTNIVFRVESAEAARELAGNFGPRDANGVAAGADVAVDRAAASSGQGLPEELKSRFESSLGTDLSSVRVHTGSESATAAGAVGARAYTVGQDIHFGAGHYDPSSAFGVHLLAHEVAHTVQQQGATPGRQNKLEVSTPQDGAEHDADRAADAMVAGVTTTVAAAPAGAARKLLRDSDGAGGADAGASTGAEGSDAGTSGTYDPPAPEVADGLPENGACMLPPKPLNWAGTPATPASPSAPWTGAPSYSAEYAAPGNLETYRAAFNTSWGEAQTGFSGLYAMHQAYQSQDKEIVPLLRISGAASVGAKGAHVNATDSFKDGALKDGAAKIDANKVPAELRTQLEDKKDKIEAAKTTMKDKAADIGNGVDAFTIANNGVTTAINELSIIKTDQEIANLNLDANQVKRDLEDFKAASKATVESIKTVTAVINCWSDPTKLFGNVIGAVNQGATAGGAIADAVATSDANEKLAGIDGKIRGLTNRKASLQASNAAIKIDSAVATLTTAFRNLQKAVRAMQTAKDDYARAYRELGQLMQKAGAASGMNVKDQAALAGAVEALPKIETILKTIEGMQTGLTIPSYNEASGIGAAMSTSAGEFRANLAIVKGNKDYVGQQKTLWEARKASVEAAINSASAVGGKGGTDW